MNVKLLPALAAVGLLSAAPAFSANVTLDFEGVNSYYSINNYYNGGTDQSGNTGANVGISFGGDALGLVNDGTGSGVGGAFFTNLPTSGSTIMAPVGADAALNSTTGFAGQVSFYYSSTAAVDVNVYDGLNGTGTVLGTFSLLNNAQSNGCTDSAFCNWNLASLSFSGVAKSIQFGSAAGLAGFDNVTVAPVPLPAAAWLLLSGLGGLSTLVRRKRNV
jgi:hypothetical protein